MGCTWNELLSQETYQISISFQECFENTTHKTANRKAASISPSLFGTVALRNLADPDILSVLFEGHTLQDNQPEGLSNLGSFVDCPVFRFGLHSLFSVL